MVGISEMFYGNCVIIVYVFINFYKKIVNSLWIWRLKMKLRFLEEWFVILCFIIV